MQPLPRFRIYTRARSYGRVLGETLLGRGRRGDDARGLERRIGDQVGSPNAVCMPKARVGIFLTLRALIQPGQRVIVSPYTISDVINMVVCAGGVPVFADLDPDTCNVAATELEKLLEAEHDVGAVMVTHLHGLSCEMERIVPLCRDAGVPLVEDAAQAFGCRSDGAWAGTLGDAGIYSFGMYKNVNAFFGGMVVTRHAELAERLREEVESFPWQEQGYFLTKVASAAVTDLATWPPIFKGLTYRVFRWGFLHEVKALNNQVKVDMSPELKRELPESYLRRPMPLQARLVTEQLEGVDEASRRRIEFARFYHEALRNVPGVGLPPLREDLSHIYSYFPIQVEDRPALLRHLMQQRRDVAAQHLHNCADLPCFAEFQRACPEARRTAASVVLLPTYPRYARRDAERNVEAIRAHFGA